MEEKKEDINILEAVLFATGRIVSKEEIEELLKINKRDMEEIFKELKNKYEGSGINILQIKDGYQMVSNKKYFAAVSDFLENSKKEGLSTTCLEVLSIIAYNSKITKAQIEDIRGVNSDSQVARLLEYGLIEEVERLKLPGRPAVFSTTNEFLKCMGINKLEDLPDYESMKDIKKEKIIIKEEK